MYHVGGRDNWNDFNGLTFKVAIILHHYPSTSFQFQGGPVQRKNQVQRVDNVLSDQRGNFSTSQRLYLHPSGTGRSWL